MNEQAPTDKCTNVLRAALLNARTITHDWPAQESGGVSFISHLVVRGDITSLSPVIHLLVSLLIPDEGLTLDFSDRVMQELQRSHPDATQSGCKHVVSTIYRICHDRLLAPKHISFSEFQHSLDCYVTRLVALGLATNGDFISEDRRMATIDIRTRIFAYNLTRSDIEALDPPPGISDAVFRRVQRLILNGSQECETHVIDALRSMRDA